VGLRAGLNGPTSRSADTMSTTNSVTVPNDAWYKENTSGLCRVLRRG
jgi:hypothetical protein